MTTRPRVAMTLGLAGLVFAVAQVLLFSSPPTWFQIAVVAFWGVVGGAYLASGLGQQWRDRLRPARPRVPDGELSTGGPGDDADVGPGGDVRDTARRDPSIEETAVVPAPSVTPVRAARPRGVGAVWSAPVPAGGRPAPPSLTPAGPVAPAPTDGPRVREVLPGTPAAPAPADAGEPTAALVSPWPHAATPSAPAPAAAPAPVTDVHPRMAPDPLPESTPATSRPATSPSFALPFSHGSAEDDVPSPRPHASGRHAVPEDGDDGDRARSGPRHRRPGGTLEQLVPAVSGAPAPARRHRAPHRRAG